MQKNYIYIYYLYKLPVKGLESFEINYFYVFEKFLMLIKAAFILNIFQIYIKKNIYILYTKNIIM